MKLFCLILLFPLLFETEASAQQNRFLYLQTENSQPFYVKLNNVIYSSSNSGYVIVPKLKDGRYEITIGFPGNKWPLQNVEYTVNKRDAGFILKNFGEKGWGLFDLQTLDVIMASAGEGKKETTSPDDSFAGTLSQVVGADLSTSVASKEEPVKEQKKEEPIRTEEKKVAEIKETVKNQEVEPVVVKIEKLFSANSTEGTDLVYIDRSGEKADTIRIFIPADQLPVVIKEEIKKTAEVKNEEAAKETGLPKELEMVKTSTGKKKKDKMQEPAFIEMELPVRDTVKKVEEDNIVAAPLQDNKIEIPNSNCRSNADERDFLKLRKNMASRRSAEDMVAVAKKDFRNRCYSVEQIKHLSVLFLDDEGKYMFLDAAYPSVHDFSNFPSLVSELKDPYYITRFEAMIRK